MARFNCRNWESGFIKITAKTIVIKVPSKYLREEKPVEEEDRKIVEEWLENLPQSVLDDPEEPLPTEDLFHLAAAKYGHLTQDDISVLSRAYKEVMFDKFSSAARECMRVE